MSPLPAFILLYVTIYSAFGAASPYWPRFFESRGLTPTEIGSLLAAGMVVRLVSGPLVGRLADATGALRATLAACAALATGFALALLAADAYWALLLVHVAQAAALAPIASTADALAVHRAHRQQLEYGWVRGAASAAFVFATLMMGQLLAVTDISAIVWMHAACLAASVGAAALVPRLTTQAGQHDDGPPSSVGGVRELWRVPLFRRLIVVAALVYGSHAVHDAFAMIRWNQAGIAPVIASLLWSEAVIAEVIVFLLIGPALVNWLGPNGAAALAAAAGVLRWLVMAQTTSVVALAIVQPLHGLTFALLHLSCMRLIGIIVPASLSATAQALYALGAGLASTSLTLLSGPLYANYGGGAFWPMAFLCGVALPLAWFGLRQRCS